MQHPQTKAYACKAYALPQPTTLLNLFTNTPVGSDIAMKGLFFVEAQAEKIKRRPSRAAPSPSRRSRTRATSGAGINIDDDQSCYDARVRFGLVLNNEANINTLNDAAGFGAQAYYTAGCDLYAGRRDPVAHRLRLSGRRDLVQHRRQHLDPLSDAAAPRPSAEPSVTPRGAASA